MFKLVQAFFEYAGVSLQFNLVVEYCVIRKQSHLGLYVFGQVIDVGKEQGWARTDPCGTLMILYIQTWEAALYMCSDPCWHWQQ